MTRTVRVSWLRLKRLERIERRAKNPSLGASLIGVAKALTVLAPAVLEEMERAERARADPSPCAGDADGWDALCVDERGRPRFGPASGPTCAAGAGACRHAVE